MTKLCRTTITSTLFPGFSPTRPTERERERERERSSTNRDFTFKKLTRLCITQDRRFLAIGVKPATTLVFNSFSCNSLVYLIVLFRQKFSLVSVIVVVGLANLSCCCDHCVNVANKPDKKNVRQRTPP